VWQRVDRQLVASVGSYVVRWELAPGRHDLVVESTGGASAPVHMRAG
jgi:hypothetical protein